MTQNAFSSFSGEAIFSSGGFCAAVVVCERRLGYLFSAAAAGQSKYRRFTTVLDLKINCFDGVFEAQGAKKTLAIPFSPDVIVLCRSVIIREKKKEDTAESGRKTLAQMRSRLSLQH